MNEQYKVAQFHEAFGHPVATEPTPFSQDRGELRYKMIEEELDEFGSALNTDDLVEQYDALIDIIYLAMGGLVEIGLPLGPGFDIVQKSNMSKLGADGKPIISRGFELDGLPEGKIMKGPDYKRPNLKTVVEAFQSIAEFRKEYYGDSNYSESFKPSELYLEGPQND